MGRDSSEENSKDSKEYYRSLAAHPSFARLRLELAILVGLVVLASIGNVLVVMKHAPSESRKELTFFLGGPCFILLIVVMATIMRHREDTVFMLLLMTAITASFVVGYTYEFILTGILFPFVGAAPDGAAPDGA